MRLTSWFRRTFWGKSFPNMPLPILGRVVRVACFSIRRYAESGRSALATALTYYTLFAIVPMAALAFGFAKGFNLQEHLRKILMTRLSTHQEVFRWICSFAEKTLQNAQGGIVAGFGVVVLLWMVLSLSSNAERVINAIWCVPPRKNLFHRISGVLSVFFVAPILLIVLSGVGMAVRTVSGRMLTCFPLINAVQAKLFSLGLDLVPVGASCVIFALIYWAVPNTKVRVSAALVGGVTAGILFQLLQDGFILLQGSIFRYNKVYGSFAVLPLFLIWLQWSWQIVFFGAEVTFVSQNLTTGVLDGEYEKKLSMQLRREYELAIAKICLKRMDAGEGPLSESELNRRMRLPPVLLEAFLEELVQSGILLPVENEDERLYTAALSPAKATLGLVLEKLNGNGITVPLPFTGAEVSGVSRHCEALRLAMESDSGGILLKNLD